MRLLQDRLEHRDEIARRGVDDLQDFGQSSLFGLGFVALGKCLTEPPPQLSVGTVRIGYLVIEHRSHVLAPVAPRYFRHHTPIRSGLHLRRDPTRSPSGIAPVNTI